MEVANILYVEMGYLGENIMNEPKGWIYLKKDDKWVNPSILPVCFKEFGIYPICKTCGFQADCANKSNTLCNTNPKKKRTSLKFL